MEWIQMEGGDVRVSAIEWIGKVRPVKVSSGKGKELQERIVFNFMVKTRYSGFNSPDFDEESLAISHRNKIKESK